MASRRVVPFGILSRYIAHAHVKPFLLGFSTVTFLLTLDFLLDYLDLFLGKGIPIGTVARLFVLGLGWMVVLSVPCGVLVAVLMAFGQMSQDNEITALRASGVNLLAAILPSWIVALVVALGLTAFNNLILPETNYAFATLVSQIHRMRPTAQIQEGVFVDDFEGYNLFVRRLDDRTGKMEGVLIIDATESRSSPRTILAKEGFLIYHPQEKGISLRLLDGEVHEADPAAADGRYHRLVFQEQTLWLKGASDMMARSVKRNRGQREMSIGAMKQEIVKLQGEFDGHQAEIDSSLARLGVSDIRELPPLDPVELRPRGWRKLIAGVLGIFSSREPPPEEVPDITPAMRRQIEELRVHVFQAAGARKRIDQYRVEIHKKFSIPFACIVFVLVGAPLGMRARRGGIAVGFLSVVFFLFYYLCLIGGEQLADRGLMAAWLAMWAPNIVLGVLGIRLTHKIARSGYSIASARRSKA